MNRILLTFCLLLTLVFTFVGLLPAQAAILPNAPVRFLDVDPNTNVYTDWIYEMSDRKIRPFNNRVGTNFNPFASDVTRLHLARSINDGILSTGKVIPNNISCNQYADVSFSNPNFSLILDLKCSNLIFPGQVRRGSEFFRSNRIITRAESVKHVINVLIQYGALNPNVLASTSANIFIDVPNNHPDFAYISAGYDLGMLQGYPQRNGTIEFRPDINILRAAHAKLIYYMVTELEKV